MADWTELPNHLIAHIANHVKVIEDFIAFRAVCTSWRIAVTNEDFDVRSPQVPLLMLGAKDEDHREFYSLSKKKVSRIFIPEARGSECISTEQGWLCTVVNDTGEMNLLHPFSRKQIKLPSRKDLLTFHGSSERSNGGNRWFCLDRAVLSANPSLTSDYVLMVHHFLPTCLAIWRPGDLDWTHIDFVHHGEIASLIYHGGLYYSMTFCGEVRSYQVAAGPNNTDVQTRLIAEMGIRQFNVHSTQYYLVELSGALLLVTRCFEVPYDHNIHTFKFKVSEFSRLMRGEFKDEVKSLGDSSIFLGRNGAICIDSRKFEGIKRNHIYFTDDALEYDRDSEGGAGRDMGSYNLEDGKIESFYPGQSTSLICPPVWVMPSLM